MTIARGSSAAGFTLPENKLTGNVTYARGPFSLFVQGRWVDSGIRDRFRTEGVDIDDNTVDSVFYADLNATYTLQGQREWELFLNVTNLFDEEPPPVPARSGFNRFVFYSGDIPHGGAITAPELLSDDPEIGRLTLTLSSACCRLVFPGETEGMDLDNS